jgi:hypothetical protein
MTKKHTLSPQFFFLIFFLYAETCMQIHVYVCRKTIANSENPQGLGPEKK